MMLPYFPWCSAMARCGSVPYPSLGTHAVAPKNAHPSLGSLAGGQPITGGATTERAPDRLSDAFDGYTASFFSQITAPVNTIKTNSRLESEVITCPVVPKMSPV